MWKQPKWETSKQKRVERFNEKKSRFLEKVNIFDKLAELTKKIKKTPITNIRNEREEITIDSAYIKMIIKDTTNNMWQ